MTCHVCGRRTPDVHGHPPTCRRCRIFAAYRDQLHAVIARDTPARMTPRPARPGRDTPPAN